MNSLINTFSLDFKLTIFNVNFDCRFAKFPLHLNDDFQEDTKAFHSHDYIEFIYIKNADTNTEFETKSQKIKVKNKQLFIIKSGVVHRFNNIERNDAFKIGVSYKIIENSKRTPFSEFLTDFIDNLYFLIVENKDAVAILELIKNDEILSNIKFESIFKLLFIYLFENYHKDNKKSNYPGAVLSVQDSINNAIIYYYNKNFTINDLSKQIFLSPKQINRICKKIYGKTFKEQIEYQRIEFAKYLLKNTDKKITEIALECGYGSSSSFTISFKKNTGLLPKEFKKKST